MGEFRGGGVFFVDEVVVGGRGVGRYLLIYSSAFVSPLLSI